MDSRDLVLRRYTQEKLHSFMASHRNFTWHLVDYGVDRAVNSHYRKLQRYIRNILFNHAGIESEVYCFGSRVIGTANFDSDLDMYVNAGKKKGIKKGYLQPKLIFFNFSKNNRHS